MAKFAKWLNKSQRKLAILNISTSSEITWHSTLISALAELKVECHFFCDGAYKLLLFDEKKFAIHLVNLKNNFNAEELILLQKKYNQQQIRLIQLWEDVCQSRLLQVIARIQSLIGLNVRIHGRKTKVQKIDKETADLFLNSNHLQGSVNSRHKLGLFEKDNLVAVATFSALRKMNHTENYRSVELIRFAVKAGYNVSGGLSKLLNYFYNQYQPNDIMTYADRDWSNGSAYEKLGFQQTDLLEPQFFYLDELDSRKVVKDLTTQHSSIFNTGSIKYILKF